MVGKSPEGKSLKPGKFYDMVDSTAEGWNLFTESTQRMMMSPLTIKKRWFKKEAVLSKEK